MAIGGCRGNSLVLYRLFFLKLFLMPLTNDLQQNCINTVLVLPAAVYLIWSRKQKPMTAIARNTLFGGPQWSIYLAYFL